MTKESEVPRVTKKHDETVPSEKGYCHGFLLGFNKDGGVYNNYKQEYLYPDPDG